MNTTTLTAADNLGQLLTACQQLLEESDVWYGHGTDNAWDESVQLVLTVAQLPLDADESVLLLPVAPPLRDQVEHLLRRRIKDRVPLPYLLGRAWFAGLEFKCDERAIVPRSPIGELIRNGFAPWYGGPAIRKVLDLCCGGGCLGLATAHYCTTAEVDLADIDQQALSLARDNIGHLGVAARARVLQSNLFAEIEPQQYDLILCNPPYVDAVDLAAMPPEYLAEPPLALGSGPDGLQATRRILADVGRFLAPDGLLILEVGYTWPALEAAYPNVPFTWVEFEHGGAGVCVLSAREWQDYSASFCGSSYNTRQ